MFDSCHVLESLFDSEQVAALVKVHPIAFPQFAHNGLVAGLRIIGKLRRFLTCGLGDYPPYAVNSEQLSVPPHHS